MEEYTFIDPTDEQILKQIRKELKTVENPLIKCMGESYLLKKEIMKTDPTFDIVDDWIVIVMPAKPDKIGKLFVIDESEVNGNVVLTFRPPSIEELQSKMGDIELRNVWDDYYEK